MTRRRTLLNLAAALLVATAAFAVHHPAADALSGVSAGCTALADYSPQGTMTSGGVPSLDFNPYEAVVIFQSGNSVVGSTKRLLVDGTVMDSSTEEPGYLTYLFTDDGPHSVSWDVSEGTSAFHIECERAIDGCGRLNDPTLDATYAEFEDLFTVFFFQPGDVIRWVARDTRSIFVDLYGYESFGTSGADPSQITQAAPAPPNLAAGIKWFTADGGDADWTVSCTRSLADACAPGAGVPSGYKLVEGTPGNDNLYAGSGKQLIRGLDGNDTINDLSGDDIACGNDGNDRINGGGGNDVLVGGEGLDTLNGGSGLDVGCDYDTNTVRTSVEKPCQDGGRFEPPDPIR